MKFNNRLKYVFPMIITAMLLCLVYAIKGIYPFGINTIDYYDMGQQIVAFYYHTFDFLHGQKNLFYDPYTALSVNMAMSTSGCSHLSLFNLFFLFVKREAILESLSIFLMLKMMIMTLFMYIYVHNRFKIDYFYELIFSVGYGFCGYVLMLYMTIQWLDVAALFPLLMLFLHRLIKDGNSVGYVSMLTLMIIASYYQSFMILIYIVLMVGVAILSDRIFNEQDELIYEKYHLLKLFVSTVVSLMLSAFIVLPQIKQTLNSARFNNENGGGLLATYFGIVSNTKPQYTTRWWSLLGTSFIFAVIVFGLWKYRREKKRVISALLALFIILSELFVEGVNLFWHFGSYVGYPIRNGYMIYFTLAVIACGFVERGVFEPATDNNGKYQAKYKELFCISLIILAVAAVFIIGIMYSRAEGLVLRNVFHITLLVMLISFMVYIAVGALNKDKQLIIVAPLMAAELVLFGFIMIGKPLYSSVNTMDPEQESEYIRTCIQLDEAFSLNAIDFDNDGESLLFSRIKNPDTSLNANYGLVLRRPVLSNWTHLLSPSLQSDASKLGYSVQYTRLLDSGGTVFSDALIGINEVISALPLDENLYELEKETEVVNKATDEKTTYYLYKCKYTLPFGVITDNVEYDIDNLEIADVYNAIYRSISGDNGNIATKEDLNNLNSSGKKAFYYLSNQVDTDDYNTTLCVNGKEVSVPSINELNNMLYPAHFNNNAIYLGTFDNEMVDVSIDISNTDRLGNAIISDITPTIISIDLDKLAELKNSYIDGVSKRYAKKAKYNFSVNAKNDSLYFLMPFSFDKGYEALNNGVKTKVIPVGGMFSAIQLNEGDNEISLKFVPDGMKAGIIISIIGIIVLALYLFLDKRNKIFDLELLWLNKLYLVMFIVAIVFMYAVPYCFAALALIHIV